VLRNKLPLCSAGCPTHDIELVNGRHPAALSKLLHPPLRTITTSVKMTEQWSFRKIGTMGTLCLKDRSSRPEGPRPGWGSWGRGSEPPPHQPEGLGVWRSAVSSPTGVRAEPRPQTYFGRRRAQKTHLAGENFVYFQSTNMRLELQNPVDYYKKNYSTQNAVGVWRHLK